MVAVEVFILWTSCVGSDGNSIYITFLLHCKDMCITRNHSINIKSFCYQYQNRDIGGKAGVLCRIRYNHGNGNSGNPR